METQLFYDLGKRGFFDSSGAATTLTELLKGCDRAQLCIAAGEFKDGKEFSPVDLSTYGVELGFTRPAACPQKGTWTATVGADTTDPLSAAPTAKALESHLNALPSVIAEGGLTVRVSNCSAGPSDTTSDCPQCADDGEVTKGPLCWDICWTTEGDKPDITLDTTPLWMDQVSSVTTQRQGDSNLTEVVQIKIREKAIAYSGTLEFAPKANSVISAADVKAGGAGSNAVQNVSISPAPIGGSFCIEIAGCQSEQISVFATADEFEDALKCSDDYRVVKTGDYSWDITYLGDTASHALLTIECDSVVSSQGVEGIFNLDTIPIKSLLNGCETVEGKIELVLTNNATGAICRHSEDFEVCRGQIDLNQPGSEVPSTAPPLTIADNGNGTATTNTGICLKTCEAPDASLSHLTLNEPPRQLTDADIPNATDSEIGDTVSVTWADGTVELVTKQPDGTWTSSTVIEHPVTLTPTTGGTEVSYFDYVTGTQVTQLITGAISDFVFNVNPDGSVNIGHDGDGSGFDVFLIPAPPQGAISVITRTTNADGSVIHNHVDGNGVAYSWTTQPAADTQSESSDFAGSAAPVSYSRDQGTETEADFGYRASTFGDAPATGESLRGGRMQQTAGLNSEFINNWELVEGNTIHLDDVAGRDARAYNINGFAFTASAYDEFRPYLTPAQAIAAAKPEDSLIVRAGTYRTFSLTKNLSVDFQGKTFIDGAILNTNSDVTVTGRPDLTSKGLVVLETGLEATSELFLGRISDALGLTAYRGGSEAKRSYLDFIEARRPATVTGVQGILSNKDLNVNFENIFSESTRADQGGFYVGNIEPATGRNIEVFADGDLIEVNSSSGTLAGTNTGCLTTIENATLRASVKEMRNLGTGHVLTMGGKTSALNIPQEMWVDSQHLRAENNAFFLLLTNIGEYHLHLVDGMSIYSGGAITTAFDAVSGYGAGVLKLFIHGSVYSNKPLPPAVAAQVQHGNWIVDPNVV